MNTTSPGALNARILSIEPVVAGAILLGRPFAQQVGV